MAKHPNLRKTNRVLASLSLADAALIKPHLEAVDLPRRRQLERRNGRYEYAYFPDSGVASVVADAASMRSVEVGMIGREGMVGVGAVMGATRSPFDAFMQVAGAGRRVETATLRDLMRDSEGLRAAILRFAHAFNVQIAHTALANARSKIEERLSRWLLMVHDRIDGAEIRLTHEFLSAMLGVRRAGVSVAMKTLEKLGLIEVKRGYIMLVDRDGLQHHANGAYGPAEREVLDIQS